MSLDLLTPQRDAAAEGHVPEYAVPLLDYGFFGVVDQMPFEEGAADARVDWCARRSYQAGTTRKRDRKALLRYLIQNGHMSPFEHPHATSHWFAPMMVQNQLVRHRTGNFSILSLRYSQVQDFFYVPQFLRAQDSKNRQASSGRLEVPAEEHEGLLESIREVHAHSLRCYESLIAAGVSREIARGVIGPNVYSDLVLTMDLRNMLHLVYLRWDDHAQQEFQVYARQLARFLEWWAPDTMEVFYELRAQGVRF